MKVEFDSENGKRKTVEEEVFLIAFKFHTKKALQVKYPGILLCSVRSTIERPPRPTIATIIDTLILSQPLHSRSTPSSHLTTFFTLSATQFSLPSRSSTYSAAINEMIMVWKYWERAGGLFRKVTTVGWSWVLNGARREKDPFGAVLVWCGDQWRETGPSGKLRW
jgi:hypothetical protein